MTDTLGMIPLELLLPSPTNPRKHFDREGLEELAKSIEQFGILSPLIVRPWSDQSDEFQGCFEIVAGERRYRGSTIAKQTEIPCIIRELTDDEVLQVQIIENLQRADIHPLEEADGFKKLIDRGVETVTTIAHKVGKSEEYVHGRIKLSALQGRARSALEQGILPIGHALLIAKLDGADQDAAAEAVGVRVDHEGKIHAYYQGIEPMRILRAWIERSLVLDMASAAFDLEDATLNPDRGACSLCPLRTINNGILFPEMAGSDRCTDRRCFDIKLSAHMERKRAELEAQGPVITISESYSRPSVEGAIPSSQYSRVPTTRQAELHAIQDRDEDLFTWLIDLEGEGFDQLAPKTFVFLAEACMRSVYADCEEDDVAPALEEIAIKLALNPPVIDFNDVRYTKADDGVEWPSIDEKPKVADVVASQPGVVMALMVDGPNKGAVVPVRLDQRAAAKVGDEDAAEKGRAERAEQREAARLRRAEMIARRRIYDCVLTMLTAEDARANFAKLLTAIAIKSAMMNANSVGDTADPETGRHPGRGVALQMLGHKGSRWEIKASKLKVPSEIDAWKATFVAMTYDEIHVGQMSGDAAEPIALMAFADVAKVDVELIRKEEEWNTLSKKQQAERSKAPAAAQPVQEHGFKPGKIVVTSYGTGPYEVVEATHSPDGWSLTLKDWGSRKKEHAYINNVQRHADGGWHSNGGTDRVYVVNTGIATHPMHCINSGSQAAFGFPHGSEFLVGLNRRRIAAIAAFKEPTPGGSTHVFFTICENPAFVDMLNVARLENQRFFDSKMNEVRPLKADAPSPVAVVDQALASTMTKVDDDVMEILARCTVVGQVVFLPNGQLERKLYERVDKVLTSIGGKWNKSKKAHVFTEDPEEPLQSVINNGAIVDRKKALQYFPTPAPVAARLVELAEIDFESLSVLEPSAGAGAIVKEIIRPGHDLSKIAAVEIDEKHQEALESLGVDVYHEDFLVTSPAYLGQPDGFDRVVMNPPFTRQQDVDHVRHAFGMLNPGGILVSVMSPSWLFRENAKSKEFRAFMEQLQGEVEDLPEGSFLESGTAVRSVILKLRAPYDGERPGTSYAPLEEAVKS